MFRLLSTVTSLLLVAVHADTVPGVFWSNTVDFFGTKEYINQMVSFDEVIQSVFHLAKLHKSDGVFASAVERREQTAVLGFLLPHLTANELAAACGAFELDASKGGFLSESLSSAASSVVAPVMQTTLGKTLATVRSLAVDFSQTKFFTVCGSQTESDCQSQQDIFAFIKANANPALSVIVDLRKLAGLDAADEFSRAAIASLDQTEFVAFVTAWESGHGSQGVRKLSDDAPRETPIQYEQAANETTGVLSDPFIISGLLVSLITGVILLMSFMCMNSIDGIYLFATRNPFPGKQAT